MSDVEERARALKEQLKDGRRNKTGPGIGQSPKSDHSITLPMGRTDGKDTRSSDQASGTTIKNVGVTSSDLRRDNDQAGDNGQRFENILERKRASLGGLGNDHPRSTESDPSARTTGGTIVVERLDDIPTRDWNEETEEETEEPPITKKNDEYFKQTFKRARGFFKGRPHKEQKPLSEAEAKRYEEILPGLLIDYGGYADKGIAWYSGQDAESMGEIWGDLSQLEAEAITRILIKRGKRSGSAANFVRKLEEGVDYIGLGIILVPRAMKTTDQLQKAPRKLRGFKR